MHFSDNSLFYLFEELKSRYPQAAVSGDQQFPEVASTKTCINLLEHFDSKAYSDPDNLNVQNINEDVNFLLNRAIQEEKEFVEDMRDILGDDVLANAKVSQVNKGDEHYFNANAVRRVFIKWA